ncbi:hypothetical protein [Streptomyces werraensis]|uniref:hypothetical protein n=1 Tax=Streptomyces werraensis TaxID=68284 RepID=UPI00342922DC
MAAVARPGPVEAAGSRVSYPRPGTTITSHTTAGTAVTDALRPMAKQRLREQGLDRTRQYVAGACRPGRHGPPAVVSLLAEPKWSWEG